MHSCWLGKKVCTVLRTRLTLAWGLVRCIGSWSREHELWIAKRLLLCALVDETQNRTRYSRAGLTQWWYLHGAKLLNKLVSMKKCWSKTLIWMWSLIAGTSLCILSSVETTSTLSVQTSNCEYKYHFSADDSENWNEPDITSKFLICSLWLLYTFYLRKIVLK